MEKKVKVTFVVLVFIFFAGKGYSQAVESILKHKDFFDRKSVSVEREVVGDIIKRGDYSIVNLKDGSFFIGLVLTPEQVHSLEFTRTSQSRGDLVKAEGIFYKECPELSGESIISVKDLVVVKFGERFRKGQYPFRTKVLVYLMVLTVILTSTLLVQRKNYGRKNT